MNEFNDGGPAFPGTEENYKFEGNAGMSLRDYFAAKAMQGLFAAQARTTTERKAEVSYEMADSMLAASQHRAGKESAEVIRLREQIEALEAMRPHWAKGYSMAAQGQTAALSQVWSELGVTDQTACMEKLRSLLK